MTKHPAVTLVELVVALALIAFIAGMTLPRLLGSAGDSEVRIRTQQVFTLIGEAFGSRKKDENFAPITNDPAGEPLTFYRFLYTNSNFLQGVEPSTVTAANLCDTPADYIRFHNGNIVRQICTITNGPSIIGMTVVVQIPVNANTTTTLTEVLLYNNPNYWTLRGYDLDRGASSPAACTKADFLLNVDDSCQGAS